MSKRRLVLLGIDTCIFLSVYLWMALLNYLEIGSISVNGEMSMLKALPFATVLLLDRFGFHIYRSVWRYARIKTYLKLMLADFTTAVGMMIIGRIFREVNLGLACFIVVQMGTTLLTLASRFLYQLWYAHRGMVSDYAIMDGRKKVGIAIVGAGNVGATLAEEMIRNPKALYYPVCFIDKDPQKIGARICDLRVYKEDEKVMETLKSMPIEEIVIALPDLSPEHRSRLYRFYKQFGYKVKLYDYPFHENRRSGGYSSEKRMLRDIRIEDLLFRDSIQVKSAMAEAFYTGKTVMVTGGGGSIGSELCRQVAELKPKRLIVVDIYENNAYDIQQELYIKYKEKLNLKVYIASVRDEKRIEEIFREERPQIVFHAAAHKHVPLMEGNAEEAIKNNVMGTCHVADMAEKYQVEKFLLISTDKAVNPTNVMGASKRLCEMVIQCRTDSKTVFTAVRFGNVLGSNGSVIPLFRRQIAAGGPVTLTDKRIIRYFMTIPEAVGLVMETASMARKGELYVLDMGDPVKILDLAENLIRLSGLQPYEDIDIVEVGLRPGEKLYEELLISTEELDKTDNEMIFIERDKPLSREQVEQKLLLLQDAVEKQDQNLLLATLRKTVPTYRKPEEVNGKADKVIEIQVAGNQKQAGAGI